MNLAYSRPVIAGFLLLCGCDQRSSQSAAPQSQTIVESAPAPPTIDSLEVLVTVIAAMPPPPATSTEASLSGGIDEGATGEGVVSTPDPATLDPVPVDWQEHPPRVATGIDLDFMGSESYRAADGTREPPEVTNDGGSYRFVFKYRPLEGGGLVGKPIATLHDMQTIRTHFSAVIAHLGLRFRRVSSITLQVNGEPHVIYSASDASRASADATIDVSEGASRI